MKIHTLDDIETSGKTVLMRADLNSPIDPATGEITDSTRIRGHVETVNDLVDAKLVILAHQGRPGDSDFVTLEQHAEILNELVRQDVKYMPDIFGPAAKTAIKDLSEGEVLVLENVRFFSEEVLNRPAEVQKETLLVKSLAPLCDVFVNDAFAAVHRSQPSIVGFPMVMPSVAGRLMQREIEILEKVLEGDGRPQIFVLGGAKFNGTVELIKHVLEHDIADKVLVSGVVGNLFLMGRGYELGKSSDFIEQNAPHKMIDDVKALIADYSRRIETPVDVAVDVDGMRVEHTVNDFPDEHQIFDIGEGTIAIQSREIKNAGTIVANGPPGRFEDSKFELGTKSLLSAMAETGGHTVIGGGHIIAAAAKYQALDGIYYISTGGGAMLEFLAGKELPALTVLKMAAERQR
ncbi:MAG: phosphoglycerate kinase [Euryarchaeota archaeon]|nr:phosphoglycerate kinase [Euryarchaeota archaeon]